MMDERIKTLRDEIAAALNDSGLEGKLDDLLSLKGQQAVKPVHFCIDEDDVEESYDGGSYCIYKTAHHAHFMTKGGYHIFVTPNYTSLYGTIISVMEAQKSLDSSGEDDETRQDTENVLAAVAYLLECPMFCFGDPEITVKIANVVIDCLNESYKKAAGKLMKESNPEADAAFREAVSGIEEIKPYIDGAAERFDDVYGKE